MFGITINALVREVTHPALEGWPSATRAHLRRQTEELSRPEAVPAATANPQREVLENSIRLPLGKRIVRRSAVTSIAHSSLAAASGVLSVRLKLVAS